MAASAVGQITVSSVQLHGMGCGRNWKLVKFCNGELMGRKVQLKTGASRSAYTKNVKPQHRICMSLTADLSTESKVYLTPFISFSSTTNTSHFYYNISLFKGKDSERYISLHL